MNKNLYNTAMNKLTMSNECEQRIKDIVSQKPQIEVTTAKKKRSFKLAPMIAAAAVLVMSTVTVAAAGGADWIKGFFSKEDIVITDEIAGFTTEISNFTCESDVLKLSPVGMIADEKTLYAMFHIDSLDEDMTIDKLCLKKAYSENYPDFSLNTVRDVGDNVYQAGSKTIDNENNFVIMLNSTEACFKNGDTLTAELGYSSELGFDVDADAESISKINFTITLGEIPSLVVNYDENITAPIGDVNCALESMTINPLTVQTKGVIVGNIDHSGYNPFLNSNITINMNDGAVVNATISGYGGGQSLHSDWFIDEPINPDNIASVYLGDLCLYTAE